VKVSLNLARNRYVNQHLVWLIGGAIGVLLLLLAVQSALSIWEIQRKKAICQNHINTFEALLEKQQPVQENKEALVLLEAKYLEASQLWERDNYHWSALLTRLEVLFPDGTKIKSLQPNYDDNSLKIIAEGRDIEHLQRLLTNFYQADIDAVYLHDEREVEVLLDGKHKEAAIEFSLTLKGVL